MFPLTSMALEAFRSQIEVAGPGQWLFPSDGNKTGHQTEFKKIWRKTLQRAGVPYFLLRQTDAQVFKKYSQMKLQMKREALRKLNRKASESDSSSDTEELA